MGLVTSEADTSGTSKGHFTTSSSSHLDYLKDIHYHFDNSSRCTSTLTVTQTGPLTSNRGSLPRAQSHQCLEYLLHSTAEHSLQSQHQSAEAELYAIGLGISDSLHIYQLLQELQQHLQRQTFDFGNIETQYNLNNSFSTSPSLTTTKSPIHIFTDSTSALSLSNKLGLNKGSKHIALRYLFVQDIQATGLVNIQRVTSHNNPADIYTKCVTSPVLERHLRHNGIIELHIEEGEINYFHILELAEQYFNVTSDEDVEYTKEPTTTE